jgi:hypothetical protein
MGKDNLSINPVARLGQVDVVKVDSQIHALAELPGRCLSYSLFDGFFYIHFNPP